MSVTFFNFKLKSALLGALLAVPGSIFAQAASIPNPTLTLKEAIQIALDKSPDLASLQEQTYSANAKARLALAPSEPTLSVTSNDLTQAFHLNSAASNVFQITQPIGFPGRAWINRSQLTDQADSISYQTRAMKMQVIVNVKTAYYNLQLAQKNIELNNDTRLAYERIQQIAKRRYESGATGQVDFLNAQVALLTNQNDLADLQTAEKTARAQLNVFLKNPVDEALVVEPIRMNYYPKIDMQTAINQMIENRNEIKAAQFTASAANKAYKLAWMSVLPDFQVSAGTTFYRTQSASPYSGAPALDGSYPVHTYLFGISFTVPIWFFASEREVITGASHDRAAADRNLDVVYNQSKMTLETVVDTINSTQTKIENFEKHILPLSEQSLNLALIDYSSGKVDFQTLSDTATARRQARLNYAATVVAYLTNYATYNQLIAREE